MDAKIKKSCPKCCQYYRLKSSGSKLDGNIPLFLSCGHSMCENCIRTTIKCEELIECPVCGQDIHITVSDQALLGLNRYALYELFPVNINTLGELTLQCIEPKSEMSSHDDDYFLNITELIKITESAQGECVECHEPTSKMCKQCGIIVCKNCFTKSHKDFIIFKNHALQNIELQSENTLCDIHKTKSLDYYCADCAKAICMDCLMVGGEKSCKNHNVTSIQEVNEAMLTELTEIIPKVDETFKRLTKTAVDIGHTLMRLNDENSSCTFAQLLNELEQHYSKLNAAIQKQKNDVTASIIKLKSTEIESLNQAKYSIAESIQKAKHTLNTISAIDTNKLKEVNMSAILKDAKEVLNMPWYLNRDEADTNLKLKVKEDILSVVNGYVQLDRTQTTTYSLCTTQVLNDRHEDIPAAPSTVVYPPEIVKDVRQSNKARAEKEKEINKPLSFIKKVPQYRSKMGSCSSLNSNTSDSSHSYQSYDQRSIVSPFPESQHPKQILEGSQELIYISHIVDPHNFYVQRACHQSNVKELLREFRNAISMSRPSVSHVAEGKVYLVLNKADNLWQRCRVMTIDRRDTNKPLYRVFCIDFGSTELVTIDKLRLLPPGRIQSPPPFAINCCLANCKPINGAWTSDDSILIQNIIDNKQAVLHVRRVRSSTAGMVTLECDISTVAHGLNVALALAFHGRACVSNTVKYPKMIGIVEKPKLFISNTDFKLNAVEDVYITHIVSPDHFYVRKEHLQSVYEKLSEDLDQEYSSSSNVDSIYLPEKDMSCAVLCGTWHRALVRECPGRGRVRVLLVDTGAPQLVHWTALRRLHPRYTVLRALATECHLAGVTPLNKKWSPSSVVLLHKFEDKLLELHVEDDRNRNSLGVTLYDKSDEDNVICINTQMIKHKFAVSFGLFMFNKNSEMDDLVITNKSPPDEPKPAPKNKEAITIMKREDETQKPKEEDLEAKDKGPLRLEAKILNYQSPSLLYVSLVHQQKVFNELFEKIQKYYSKKKLQGKNIWNVGDRCCTLCCQSQTFRRAAILEVKEGDAKVFYSDFACVETVPLANLRELPEDFASIGDAAIMCHLSGVIPAVGDEWPSLTKEYLNELLDAYKRIFITKLGKFKGKSMPVELWVYHTIQGGALEPNKSEWRCLNKKIIEQGLGIPDKSEESASESTSITGDDMLSFFNISGSVRDWLQIEPMPLKPLQIKSDSDAGSVSSTPGTDKTEEDVNSKTVFISDWLPPEPLPTTEFTAMPTYTDNDGVIYLHDIAQEDTLDLIRKALDVRFKSPDHKAKYYKWSIGEPCIALYFLDNRFYRGRIISVNNQESTCLVHYIDYGNEEICAFENLRKSIALYQIPIQAHKCILNRIQPLGTKWDRTSLDYIHRSIVEKHCYVKVSGEAIGDLIPIELKYDRLWINDHLVEFEMARYVDGSEAVIRKYAPNVKVNKKLEQTIDTDSGPDYIIEYDTSDQDSVQISSLEGKDWNEVMELDNIEGKFTTYKPYEETEFLCTITVLNELNRLELNVIHNEEMGDIYDKMYEELQRDGGDMSEINGIFENKACIALFPEDGKWYRASILEYSKTSNRIKVKYVDYGNIKVLSLSDVREITDKYTELPPASVTATLYGVRINENISKVTLSEHYEQTFLDQEPFHAEVMDIVNSVPSVKLTRGGKLVYDNLISEYILLRVD